MSQIELFQSVLRKLGQLSSSDLAEVDAFLSKLTNKYVPTKPRRYKTRLAKIAGTWSDWDEREFDAFLAETRQKQTY